MDRGPNLPVGCQHSFTWVYSLDDLKEPQSAAGSEGNASPGYHAHGNRLGAWGRHLAIGIYVVALVVTVVGVDILILGHNVWARLLASIGIVLVFASLLLAIPGCISGVAPFAGRGCDARR